MASGTRGEGVHIVEAARFNAMQGVCDCARIWVHSKGEDKTRAEQDLIQALTAFEQLPPSDEEE